MQWREGCIPEVRRVDQQRGKVALKCWRGKGGLERSEAFVRFYIEGKVLHELRAEGSIED